jgi:D-sedoheptulose 7-phosphate isomerase
MIRTYLTDFIKSQQQVLKDIPLNKVEELIAVFHDALKKDKNIFVFGNGGSAANASHFVTDLGKSASDKMGKRFRCLSLNDNISWITAIGNDYTYEDIFVRQLENYAKPGDIVMALSVSGRSPNVVKALKYARENNLYTIALVGSNGKELTQFVDFSIVINSTHYARVEDAQMGICHMICYAFIEVKAGEAER